jgi:hypothetical protein
MRVWQLLSLMSAMFAFGCSGENNKSSRNLNSATPDAGETDSAHADADDAGEEPGDGDGATGEGPAGGDAGANTLDAGSSEPDGGSLSALDGAASDAASDTGTLPDTGGSGGDGAVGGGFSILVRVHGAASAEQRVFFQSATGALLSEHRTAADGTVSSTEAPATVTVLASIASGLPVTRRLLTFESVVTGDRLVADFEVLDPVGSPAYLASFAGTLPAGSIGAIVRAGYQSCASASDYTLPIDAALELSWRARCPVAASNSLLATAVNSSDFPIGFSFAKGAPAFGGSALPVQLSAWETAGLGTLTVTNVPTAMVLNALLLARSEGVDLSPGGRLPSLPAGSGTRTQMLPYPIGFADSFLVRIDSNTSPEGWVRTLASRDSATVTSFSFDFASGLPGATSATLDKTVPSRPIYRWTAAPGVTAADAVAVRLAWVQRVGAEGTSEVPWTFITLPGATSVQVPELPADVPDLAGGPTFLYVTHAVTYMDSSLQSNYREFLGEPARQPQSNTQTLRRELNDTGNLRATTWFPGTTL